APVVPVERPAPPPAPAPAPAPRVEPVISETPDLVGSWVAYQRLAEGGIGAASLAELVGGAQRAPVAPAPGPPGPSGTSSGLLAWALHGVDARALIDHLRRANPWVMLETIALATCTFPLRAIRWRLILRGTGGSPLPLGSLWHATAIGFMANNLLPVRAGEL